MTTKPISESSAVETVQEAVYRTVHNGTMPPKAIAQGMNIPQSILYDIADETRERKLRAEEIPSLVLTTDDYTVLDVIERAVGRVGVMLPTGDEVTLAMTSETISEFGQFLEKLASSSSDGYTKQEARQIGVEGRQAIAKIAGLIKQVEKAAGIQGARR